MFSCVFGKCVLCVVLCVVLTLLFFSIHEPGMTTWSFAWKPGMWELPTRRETKTLSLLLADVGGEDEMTPFIAGFPVNRIPHVRFI